MTCWDSLEFWCFTVAQGDFYRTHYPFFWSRWGLGVKCLSGTIHPSGFLSHGIYYRHRYPLSWSLCTRLIPPYKCTKSSLVSFDRSLSTRPIATTNRTTSSPNVWFLVAITISFDARHLAYEFRWHTTYGDLRCRVNMSTIGSLSYRQYLVCICKYTTIYTVVIGH